MAAPAASVPIAASPLFDGSGAVKRPPALTNPPNSIMAKALHAFWWSLRPYLPHGAEGLVADGDGKGNGRTIFVAGLARPDGSARRTGIAAGGAAAGPTEDGTDVAAVIHYNTATRALVVSFTGSADSVKSVLGSPKPVALPWLEASAPEAQVVDSLATDLERVMGDDSGLARETVFAGIAAVTKGQEPLSILCTGYGMGGALATLGALRLALRYPLASTACVSFGSPNVGNAAFVEAFHLLIGQSFRCEIRREGEGDGDPLTAYPQGAGWAFPSSVDVVCKPPVVESDPWRYHKLSAYFQALLETVQPDELPYNGPGVFLLAQPKTILKDINRASKAEGPQKPWPIDDDFVPSLAASEAPLTSPFDVSFELEGGELWPAHELFDRGSQLWKAAAAALERQLKDYGTMSEILDAVDWQPVRELPRRADTINARMVAQPKPEVGLFGLVKWLATRAAERANSKEADPRKDFTQDTNPLPFLDFEAPCDLGRPGTRRACDKLSAHRLPLALLLSGAAYRASETGKVDEDAEAPPSAILLPRDAVRAKADPFGAAIQKLIAQGKVLGYRLIDDKRFAIHDGNKWDTDKVENTTNTQAYVVLLADGTAVFAFRGTAQLLDDWLTNVDWARKSIAGVKDNELERGDVHQGFMRGFCSVAYRGATDVLPDGRRYFAHNLAGTLRELMESHPATKDSPLVKQNLGPTRVICVGHSLGGALATLGAAWAAEQYPLAPVSLYTFGQPRVGDRQFVTHLETITNYVTRCVHRCDGVPLVPLHTGQQYNHYYPAGYLDTSFKDRFSVFPPGPGDFQLAETADHRWLTLLPTIFFWRGVADHDLDNGYGAALDRALRAMGAKPQSAAAQGIGQA